MNDILRSVAINMFLAHLPEQPPSKWPNRLLMEIECITDPDELEAACNLGLQRVALLRSGK